ncbi:hypothetical protein, partial [Methanosarcina mazei]|uniref:hypothetical protein n=1 Tax=Methanosarcina mazei TaxID=2209 RepID=UPI00064EF14C
MLPEKGSICGVARATGHDKDTICRWLEIAGTHSEEVTTYFLRNLVTAQSIVNGAPMSAARIPSKTGKPFFFPVEMY